MALNYYPTMLGTLVIKQPKYENGEHVADKNGKPLYNKYKIQIRQGNCLAVFIYAYKKEGQWWHQLYTFFNDEQHVKNIIKNCDHLFSDEVVSIELNMYYKESKKLLNLLIKAGYKVTCYYEQPKKK